MIDFKLRHYQEEDVQLMVKRKKFYNCNDMGLGKTLETLEVRKRVGAKSTLIIAPKIATGVWQNEAKKFYGWDSTIYKGTPKARKEIWKNLNTDIVITNPAQLKEIVGLQNKWDMVVCDEAHLAGLLNHKTATYKLFEKIECEYFYPLTGTPIRRNPADLYAPLHLINPKVFKSYWQFVNKYCNVIDNGFGKEILSKPKNPLEFKKMLDWYMIRRLKKDYLEELPEKIRGVIPIEMSGKQAKAYKQMEEEMMLIEDVEDFTLASTAMVKILRLRQLLVCPKMLGVDDYGNGIRALAEELIPNDFKEKRSVIICTPFRKAIPFIKEYLISQMPDIKIFEIHGDIKETAAEVAAKYQACKSIDKVLIYTIKSGASFTATDASMVYFLGAEWTNTDNFQAEDRCYRIGQKRSVDVKYFCYKDSVDDEVRDRLNSKSASAAWVLRPEYMIEKIKERKRKGVAFLNKK